MHHCVKNALSDWTVSLRQQTSTRPTSLSFTNSPLQFPSHTHTFAMSTASQLSPQLWRKLPSELIQEVLNHFIDDLLGDHDLDWINEDEIPRGELPQLLDPWTKYRHMSLFSGQKRRIERHYRDLWLSRIMIYLYLDPNMWSTSRRMLYCRYLSCPEGKDSAMTLPEVEVKEGGDEVDAEEKVTFFLRGPVRSARENSYGETSKREFGKVPEILPRVESAWGKVLKGKTERLGLAMRTKEQTLESGPEDNLWTSESEVVLKGLEVLDQGQRVQFNWRKLMSKFLLKFGLYNGYTYVPEPGVEVSEDEDDGDDRDELD